MKTCIISKIEKPIHTYLSKLAQSQKEKKMSAKI